MKARLSRSFFDDEIAAVLYDLTFDWYNITSGKLIKHDLNNM